jgi:glutamate-1-semialdehyde 2,1-aminomutase
MTGFRVALGGAQSVYAQSIPGFRPRHHRARQGDRGGMPLAAFGGQRAIMEKLASLGPVYQAGRCRVTRSLRACGLATLREIARPGFFEALSARTCSLVEGLCAAAREAGVPFSGRQ